MKMTAKGDPMMVRLLCAATLLVAIPAAALAEYQGGGGASR